MINCPGCSFLMGEDETLCSYCRSTGGDDSFPSFPLDQGSGGGAGNRGTLLLERPVTAPVQQPTIRYRDPERRMRVFKAVIVTVILFGAVGAGAWMALDGRGPLGDAAVRLGLAEPPPVVVPNDWVTFTSEDGSFTASLPSGAEPLSEQIDEGGLPSGTLTGFTAQLGTEGELKVASTDLGVGAAALRALDDAGFDQMIDRFLDAGRFGVETVRREVLLGEGRARDSVVAGHDDRSATRFRFVLAGGRLHVLMTQGPDEGAAALDEAHARALAGHSADA